MLAASACFVYVETTLRLNGYGLWSHVLPRTTWFGASTFWNDRVKMNANRQRSYDHTMRNFSVLRLTDELRAALAGRQQGPLPVGNMQTQSWMPQKIKDAAKHMRQRDIARLEELNLSLDAGERMLGSEDCITQTDAAIGFPFRCVSFTQRAVISGPSKGRRDEAGIAYLGSLPLPVHLLWTGFVGNTLTFATVACGSALLFRWSRTRSRLRRGLCPECSYDLNHNHPPGCPECGWNKPPTPAAGPETQPTP